MNIPQKHKEDIHDKKKEKYQTNGSSQSAITLLSVSRFHRKTVNLENQRLGLGINFPTLEIIMGKKHLLWLLYGILFWGVFPVSLIGILEGKNPFQLAKLISFFVSITVLITFVIHYYIGGFEVKSPKKWFFYPIMCWILFVIFQFLDISTVNDWFFMDILEKLK